MSDIHIGKSPLNEHKGLIKVEMYFHVPNSKVNNSYPGSTPLLDSGGNPISVSSAPGVTGQELTDLEAALESGTLCEVYDTKFFEFDGSAERKNEIKAEIRNLWADIASTKQAELDNEYPFYGIPLSKAV